MRYELHQDVLQIAMLQAIANSDPAFKSALVDWAYSHCSDDLPVPILMGIGLAKAINVRPYDDSELFDGFYIDEFNQVMLPIGEAETDFVFFDGEQLNVALSKAGWSLRQTIPEPPEEIFADLPAAPSSLPDALIADFKSIVNNLSDSLHTQSMMVAEHMQPNFFSTEILQRAEDLLSTLGGDTLQSKIDALAKHCPNHGDYDGYDQFTNADAGKRDLQNTQLVVATALWILTKDLTSGHSEEYTRGWLGFIKIENSDGDILFGRDVDTTDGYTFTMNMGIAREAGQGLHDFINFTVYPPNGVEKKVEDLDVVRDLNHGDIPNVRTFENCDLLDNNRSVGIDQQRLMKIDLAASYQTENVMLGSVIDYIAAYNLVMDPEDAKQLISLSRSLDIISVNRMFSPKELDFVVTSAGSLTPVQYMQLLSNTGTYTTRAVLNEMEKSRISETLIKHYPESCSVDVVFNQQKYREMFGDEWNELKQEFFADLHQRKLSLELEKSLLDVMDFEEESTLVETSTKASIMSI